MEIYVTKQCECKYIHPFTLSTLRGSFSQYFHKVKNLRSTSREKNPTQTDAHKRWSKAPRATKSISAFALSPKENTTYSLPYTTSRVVSVIRFAHIHKCTRNIKRRETFASSSLQNSCWRAEKRTSATKVVRRREIFLLTNALSARLWFSRIVYRMETWVCIRAYRDG